ncbi:MAG: hypothetical protein ACTH3D_12135 [Halomonas sp.]|uniref:hypothetical protein n=1 Tax=Halomonas sp. TaxID=1486246 RepID=UPI003F8E4147
MWQEVWLTLASEFSDIPDMSRVLQDIIQGIEVLAGLGLDATVVLATLIVLVILAVIPRLLGP